MSGVNAAPTEPQPGPEADPASGDAPSESPSDATQQPDTDPRAKPRDTRPGYRIGPFIFVPQWSSVEGADPWAHRKGEPRMLVLFWTIYLLLAAAATLFATRAAGLVRTILYQHTSRRLMVLIVIGACILWPMVRLCQKRADGLGMKSILADWLGVALPVAAVFLPLPLLTGWTWALLGAVWSVIAGWALVCLSVAAWGTRRSNGTEAGLPRRVLAMVAVLLVVSGGWWLASAPGAATRKVARWSPISHVVELTRPASGLIARAEPGDWRAVTLVWGIGAVLCVGVGRVRSSASLRDAGSAGLSRLPSAPVAP